MAQVISIPLTVRLREHGRSAIVDVERRGAPEDILPSYEDAIRWGRTPQESFALAMISPAAIPPLPRPVLPRALSWEGSSVAESPDYEAPLVTTRGTSQESRHPLRCASRGLLFAGAITAVSVCGAGAVFANLLGSKIMGISYGGYGFEGNANMLNYLAMGVAFSPVNLSILLFVLSFGKGANSGDAPRRRGGICLMVGGVGVGAAVGASAAYLAQRRGQLAQDVMHSAAATGVGTAVILGAAAIFSCC